MSGASSIYSGWVVHRRVKPVSHAFRYRCYWLLFDLDDLSALARRLRLFSHNRFNLFSFYDRDHAHGRDAALRPQMEQHLARAGVRLDGGAIRILCMPRVLGFVFNPLSVHFCYGPHGDLRAMVYEVHHTFRQRHSYVVAEPPRPAAASGRAAVEQRAPKRFYVSPFMDMAMTYDFKVHPPEEDVAVFIRARDPSGQVLAAWLSGTRRQLTDGALIRLFVSLPLVTLKVVAAIHWQALLLWWKGVALVPRPAPPAEPVTLQPSREPAVAE
jgi:DUF1365 family protein